MRRTKYDRVAEYLSISVIVLCLLGLLLAMAGNMGMELLGYFVVWPLTGLLIVIEFLRRRQLRRE